MTLLETEHLTIRPMTLDDADDMFLIFSDETAMRYIPHVPHKTVEETKEHFASRLPTQWSIRKKGKKRVIGALNLINARTPGMGYIIHPDYWGQGITAEASHALLDYTFTNLVYDRIELWIDETNKPSQRVAQKLGFQMKGRLPSTDRHTGKNCYLQIWGVLKSEWLSDTSLEIAQDTTFYSAEPVLMVHDLEATIAFYKKKLGFNIDFRYGEPSYYAIVSRGEWTGNMVTIHLSQVSDGREIVPSASLHIRVDKRIDALFEQYRDKGVTIIDAPEDKPWGLREFIIEDLNGHKLVFAS